MSEHMATKTNIKDVKEGDSLVSDGGFDCLKKGERHTVKKDHEGDLYIDCKEGRHYLEGQLDFDDTGFLVGLVKS